MLEYIGQRGQWVLPLGVIAALVLPSVAAVMQPAIGPLVALLLLCSFLQLNPNDKPTLSIPIIFSTALNSIRQNARQIGLLVVVFQLVLPVILILTLRLLALPDQWLIPIGLVAGASCIAGGPSIVMMLDGNARKAIEILIVSTLALPLTALPVLALLPFEFSGFLLLRTAVILAMIIVGAYALAKLIQRTWLGTLTPIHQQRLAGVAAILLAFMVLGLMSAIHTGWDTPGYLLATLFWACLVNVTLQCIGVWLSRFMHLNLPICSGVMCGNRAAALYIAALPESAYQPYLLFIACYQVPMYLTPLIGRLFYENVTDYGK